MRTGWARAAGVRAAKTALESALAGIAGCATLGDVRWEAVAMSVLVGTLSSLAISLGGLPEVAGGGEG